MQTAKNELDIKSGILSTSNQLFPTSGIIILSVGNEYHYTHHSEGFVGDEVDSISIHSTLKSVRQAGGPQITC
jgi:hypothetical protein